MAKHELPWTWFPEDFIGYEGKHKDEDVDQWNHIHGEGNWQLVWLVNPGKIMSYLDIFWQVYVPGYELYFASHNEEAEYLAANFSFAYDKELITKAEAYNPLALYNKPGHANQFHHVALNLALSTTYPFKGKEPIQVREGKPGTDISSWPKGWKWSPGRIPSPHPEWAWPVPKLRPQNAWWQPGTVEDLYQTTKVLLVRRTSVLPRA